MPSAKNTGAFNLQDNFLNEVRKSNTPVTIHLMNGFQLRGNVQGFDSFTVVIESMGKQQLVYKHAISTITPGKSLPNDFSAADVKKIG